MSEPIYEEGKQWVVVSPARVRIPAPHCKEDFEKAEQSEEQSQVLTPNPAWVAA